MIKHYFFSAFFLFAVVSLSGCLESAETDFEKRQREEDELINSYLKTNNIDATKGNYGIYYLPVHESISGIEVKDNDIVSLGYSISTLDGDFVDSTSAANNESVMFTHKLTSEYNIFPKGFDLGVDVMEVGDTYKFFIPSFLAFGNYAYKTKLPSNSILIADLTVVDVRTENELLEAQKDTIEQYITAKEYDSVYRDPSGFFYISTEAGSGTAPTNNQTVQVDYVGEFLDGEEFDKSEKDKPLVFTLGNSNIISGFDSGIRKMKKGESGILILPSKLAYGGDLQVIPNYLREDYLDKNQLRNLPPYSVLVFEVHLKEVQ